MKFLIVDDHDIVRQGIRQVLHEEFAHSRIVEAANGHDALNAFRQQDFDAVILDIGLPDKIGLDVLKEMVVLKPSVPIVLLSLFSEEQYVIRAVRSGASGYVIKETMPEELVLAVKKVLAGGKYISPNWGEHIAGLWAKDSPAFLMELLSDREREVLRLIGKGKTVSEIARQLTESVKTIRTYRTRLLEKLHARTTPELIRYARDHGLIP